MTRWKPVRWVLAGALLLVAAEVGLRLYGFGDPPLYQASDRYEYVYRANQDVRRFGNHVVINEASLRSDPLTPGDGPVILLVGDSVVNGGVLTDQDDLASTRLERDLASAYGPAVRVLNVSAGSWGPGNAAAFLSEKGTFGADAMIVVFSSHDATDGMTFKPVVGVDLSYPDERPPLAVYELATRYVAPRAEGLWSRFRPRKPTAPASEARPAPPPPRASPAPLLDDGWSQLVELGRSLDIPVGLYLHPTLKERTRGRYSSKGQRILSFADSSGLPVLEGLSVPMGGTAYRDDIHLNAEGQRLLAGALNGLIREVFPPSSSAARL